MELRRVVVVVWLLLVCSFVSAQTVDTFSIYRQVSALSTKYKNEKGIKTFIANDGFKLQTVKMMLRKEFGKEFVDNIREFVILFYKDANRDVADRMVSDIKQIVTPLQNVDISDQLKPGAKGQGFVRLSDNEKRLTDLLIVMDAPSPRLIYFGGDFAAEDVKYNNRQ